MAGCSDEDYVCTLDEASLKKAKDELNDDPKNRLGAVQTLRQWVQQQPHLRCPTDIQFLLAFLRVRRFSQLEARKLIENFLTRRTKFASWFQNLDPADSKIQAILDDGFILVLPKRDSDGRRIMMMRPGHINVDKKLVKSDLFRAFACVIDYLYLTDEMTTVNGTVSVVDVGHYSMKHHSMISLEERKDFIQTWQSNFPARVKQIHIYNTAAMADLILTVIKFCMSDKIQQRIKIHGQMLESVYKDVPMHLLPVEYLPDDYIGPNAGTEREIIENMKRELCSQSVRSRIMYLSSDQFGVDLARKPVEDAPQASFRKLNVD